MAVYRSNYIGIVAAIATCHCRQAGSQDQQSGWKRDMMRGTHEERTVGVGQQCGYSLHLPHLNLLHSFSNCLVWPVGSEAVRVEVPQPGEAVAASDPRQSARYRSYDRH